MDANTDNGVPSFYYEAPDSLLDMDDETHSGLIAIGVLATVSLVFTMALLSFISWRMIAWRSHYSSFIGRNQSIVLIYQLILADFLQSLGFIISFHWASQRSITGPDGACFTQGWLIQVGDVSSAFFVLAIALHTTYQVVLSRSLSHRAFLASVAGVWAFSLLLTSLAPIIGGRFIFQRAGVWCWIRSNEEGLRLFLHYLWIFIVQFGSILIYCGGFYYLLKAKGPNSKIRLGASADAINRASMAMLAYALAYTILTLPLAYVASAPLFTITADTDKPHRAGRMAAMSKHPLPDSYFLVAGCFFTSSGWVDTLLYAATRRSLLFQELSPHPDQKTAAGRRSRANGAGMSRQSSTDNILPESGFGAAFGGITKETTVKVELDDMETQSVSADHRHGYSVSSNFGTPDDMR